MAKKDAALKKHQKVLKRHKMRPIFWVVTRELEDGLICRNWITGEFRFISK